MEIVPRQNFRDARSVPAKFSRYDPRSENFSEREVIVNLKDCTSVRPPAVLWCTVYLLLATIRGSNCTLVAPDDAGVCGHLTELGLFRTLREANVNVLHHHVVEPAGNVLLPLTRFNTLNEAAELTNSVEESLYRSGQGSANIHPLVCELLSELLNNAAEHSESSIGAFGLVHFYSSGQDRRFICGVADGGIGIRSSIERNPALEHYGRDWSAIELATKELVSGTMSKTRGIGLYSVFEEMHILGRELVVHSGRGILEKGEDSQLQFVKANSFPGTMVYFSVQA